MGEFIALAARKNGKRVNPSSRKSPRPTPDDAKRHKESLTRDRQAKGGRNV